MQAQDLATKWPTQVRASESRHSSWSEKLESIRGLSCQAVLLPKSHPSRKSPNIAKMSLMGFVGHKFLDTEWIPTGIKVASVDTWNKPNKPLSFLLRHWTWVQMPHEASQCCCILIFRMFPRWYPPCCCISWPIPREIPAYSVLSGRRSKPT